MAPLHVVLGASGPVGRALVDCLLERGTQVRTVSRSHQIDGLTVPHVSADCSSRDACIQACASASVIYNCIGLDYNGEAFLTHGPKLISNCIAAAEAHSAVFVHAGDLYFCDPESLSKEGYQVGPDTPMISSDFRGKYRKPYGSAKMAKLLEDAHVNTRCHIVDICASDLYGPRVLRAAAGYKFFGQMIGSKPPHPETLVNVNTRHSFTYVEDYARALAIAAVNSSAWGRRFVVPDAEPISLQEMCALAVGPSVRVRTPPAWLRACLAKVIPSIHEVHEVAYQFDHDFVVASNFAEEFPEFGRPTPTAEGVKTTLEWYRNNYKPGTKPQPSS